MSLLSEKYIGGYLGLELPVSNSFLYKYPLFFQSARAAFYSLLLFIRPKLVWMPAYICPVMFEVINRLNIKYKIYHINENFDMDEDIDLADNDLIIYVNYFGICFENQKKILNKYDKNQIVFDNSQALFSPPLDCLATIYSPRKFIGIPDGGVLITKLKIREPNKEIIDLDSLSHLIMRMNGFVEDGYELYKKNEKRLEDFENKGISNFSEKWMGFINWSRIAEKRNSNYMYLKNVIKRGFDKKKVHAPLCYPFFSSIKRDDFIKKGIFVPSFWDGILFELNDFEMRLVNEVVFFPCDHRYSIGDYKFFIEEVL